MRGKVLLILILLAGLIGCNNSVSEIGSSLITNTLFNITFVDSVSLKVTTALLYDSIDTSTAERLLVGYHRDEKLGTISSNAIFQVGINSQVKLDRHTIEYRSLKLLLRRDGYSCYDTTQSQTIAVHQLSKGLKLNNGFLYNTSKFSVEGTPLGKITFLPRPHRKDSIEIALPDELGQQLIEMAYSNDIRLSTPAEFIKFFRGFALMPDSTTSGNMLGFKLTPEMRLYVHDNTRPTAIKDSWVTFPMTGVIFYNHIFADRSGTGISSIKKQNQSVSSSLTDHEAYLQCGGGLGMRIDMPYVRDFLINDRNFLCTRAVLEMMPIKEFESQIALPTPLYVYRVDAQNRLLTTAPLGAILFKDGELGINTHYTADITAFVNSQIQTDAYNNNALLILPDAFGGKPLRSTVNRLYIGDKKNQYPMKLKLYYISLNN